MNKSSLYADSLLNAYLAESKDTLVDSNAEADLAPELRPLESRPLETIPQIVVEPSQHDEHEGPTFIAVPQPAKRISVISTASTYNSNYSSVSENEDLDLQSVRMKLEHLDTDPKRTRLGRFRKMFRGQQDEAPPKDENEAFLAHVKHELQTSYYAYDKTATLHVPWADAAEVLLFGQPLDAIFTSPQSLLRYLMESSYELGEVRFSNMSRYHLGDGLHVPELLRQLQPNLDRFNDVLDLYAESDSNIRRPELFEMFSAFANQADGLPIALAVSMFGNWLLSYNKDAAIANNYQNTLILDYFRKAARLALVVRKAAPLFEDAVTQLDKKDQYDVSRYWSKDNSNALATSLHSLAEYYQYIQDHNMAVTIWELNCHLTGDPDSGRLAVLGLTNGYGFGNRAKEHNRFGKKSKTNKFNTKRRIAHLYRVLMKLPSFEEYGVSWATKEKYD